MKYCTWVTGNQLFYYALITSVSTLFIAFYSHFENHRNKIDKIKFRFLVIQLYFKANHLLYQNLFKIITDWREVFGALSPLATSEPSISMQNIKIRFILYKTMKLSGFV